MSMRALKPSATFPSSLVPQGPKPFFLSTPGVGSWADNAHRMERSKLRRQIAWEAARLMYDRQESEYYRAKMKSARRIQQGWVKPADLPSNAEIRDQLQILARMYEGESRTANLQAMRLAAYEMMQRLAAFRPRLIGSVLTGHIRQGSDIDLHLFSHSVEAITHELDWQGLVYEVERKQVRRQGESQTFVHIHLQQRFPFELTIYDTDLAHHAFKSSITGKPIERASAAELESLLRSWYPEIDLKEELRSIAEQPDSFQIYESLLLPCENVKQHPQHHPEGDALYHSLQVFDLACDQLPYDEEFLLAALLHDVGKAIDPSDHVQAGLQALEGEITPRTAWLIEHHKLVHKLVAGTLGRRAHRRLRESDNYDELLLLGECDRHGRQPGVQASTLDEALDYLRALSRMCQ